MIYLAEIDAFDVSTNNVVTLRFSTGTGFLNGSNFYEPRIDQASLMSREIFSDGRIGGRNASSYGELTLFNPDGELDYLTNYAVDGRELRIYYGDETQTYASFNLVLEVVMSQLIYDWGLLSVTIKDKTELLDVPLQTNFYQGNNVLPAGLEGVTDLFNTPKIKFFGRVSNGSAVLVNSSLVIYQANDGAVSEIVSVFDKGVYLGRGADYSNVNDMMNSPPIAGTFRVLKSGGYIRLGLTPIGKLTFTGWEYNTVEGNTAAQVIKRILVNIAGYSSGDYVDADFTILDSQNAASVGLIVQQDETIASVIDRIATSVGAWWGFDYLNRFRIIRLDLPVGVPVFTFGYNEVINIQREQPQINGSIYPVWKISMTYDHNPSVQSESELSGSVPTDRKNWLTNATRTVTSTNTTIKNNHKLAQTIDVDTYIISQTSAQIECDRQLELFNSATAIYTVTVALSSTLLTTLDIGSLVSLKLNRFNLASGGLFRIIKIQTDYQNNQLEFKLWG